MATVDRNNEVYVRELRYRADQYIDEVVVNHIKNGGKFEAKQATVLLMTCIEYARLATDMLAANGLLPPEDKLKKTEEVASEVSDLG